MNGFRTKIDKSDLSMQDMRIEKNKLETGLNDGLFEDEGRGPEPIEIPKLEKVEVETTTELLIIILCTIISTILSLLDALNIGPFETTNRSGDFLVIFLAIPLILILFLNHYFRQIISVFLLTYSTVIIYKYLFARNDIEPLLIIGVLALSVYLCFGLSLKGIRYLVNICCSFVGKRYRIVGGFFLTFMMIVGIYCYFTDKHLQVEVEQFFNGKIEKARYWIISNHIRRIEKIEFKNLSDDIAQKRSHLKRISDTPGDTNWFYGDMSLRYKNSIYAYLMIRENGVPVFRLVINYVGRNKTIKFYSIVTGEKVFDISPGEIKSSKVFVWYIETYECEISKEKSEMIKNILASDQVVIKYNGKDFSVPHQISSEERKNLSRMISFYNSRRLNEY